MTQVLLSQSYRECQYSSISTNLCASHLAPSMISASLTIFTDLDSGDANGFNLCLGVPDFIPFLLRNRHFVLELSIILVAFCIKILSRASVMSILS